MSDKDLNQIEEEVNELDEADAQSIQASTLPAGTSASRSDLIAKMVAYASRMDRDTLAQAVETISATPEEIYQSTQQTTGDNSSKNKASIKSSSAQSAPMPSVKEDLALMFGDSSDLSEDFRLKTEALFEAAISTRLAIETAKLEESFEEQLDESIDEIKNEMVENIDNYLNYAVAEWIAENRLAVDNNIRTQVAESFLSGLKELFEDHYVDIPEDQVDVVESMAERIEELEAMVNETTDKNIELSKVVSEKEVREISDSLSEGLTDTQKDKFTKLVEAVDYSNVSEFQKKASIIKETYFSGKSETRVATPDQLLSESVDELEKAPYLEPDMAMYVSSLSKSIKR